MQLNGELVHVTGEAILDHMSIQSQVNFNLHNLNCGILLLKLQVKMAVLRSQ